MGSKFAGLTGESDPALGHRLPDSGWFSHRRFLDSAGRRSRSSLERPAEFVTVLGGAYFFLPGIRALRYLATAR